MIVRILSPIAVVFLLMGCDNGDSNETVRATETSASTDSPGLDRATWRDVILGFYDYGDRYDPDALVQGEPVSDHELDELEEKIGVPLPTEFRQFYGTQNGFGMKQEDGTIDWVFVPVADIPALTSKSQEWMLEKHPEIADRIICFVDWHEDESVGFLLSEAGAPLRGVYSFVRASASLDPSLYGAVEVGIYNLLTEPNPPPRFLARNKRGEQDGADQPATAPESKPDDNENPKSESEGRSQ